MRLPLSACALISAVLFCCGQTAHAAPAPASAPVLKPVDGPVLAPVPATGGILPTGELSDKVAWTRFIEVVTPVNREQAVFETWASDHDIYTDKPHWPSGDEAKVKKLYHSVLGRSVSAHPTTAGEFNDGCSALHPPIAGNFPVAGSNPPAGPIKLTAPQPCFGEEVRRNHASFHYLVENGLHTQAGLKQAWQKAQSSTWRVSLPNDAVEVKADWVPLETLVDWLAANRVKTTIGQLKQRYYTTVTGGVTYALVSMHLSSKETPNWVWASFEHHANPGRCDTMGCYDRFGARETTISPHAARQPNEQYGSCVKTPALAALFKTAGLDGVWNNYCLKVSQIDFVSKKGAPLMAGDSFTERIAAAVPINQSSCIACHAAAAVNPDGTPFTCLLNKLPMGVHALPKDTVAMDFIWGIVRTSKPTSSSQDCTK
jgi:hypothetical protein